MRLSTTYLIANKHDAWNTAIMLQMQDKMSKKISPISRSLSACLVWQLFTKYSKTIHHHKYRSCLITIHFRSHTVASMVQICLCFHKLHSSSNTINSYFALKYGWIIEVHIVCVLISKTQTHMLSVSLYGPFFIAVSVFFIVYLFI
jgi:hypothetical protein